MKYTYLVILFMNKSYVLHVFHFILHYMLMRHRLSAHAFSTVVSDIYIYRERDFLSLVLLFSWCFGQGSLNAHSKL